MKKITKNNKGFSLIELIIVIAIMAVLVAIIAPNLTKYLGSSKKNTDKKNSDEIVSTIKTCITDFETTNGDLMSSTGTATVTWSATGSTVTGTSNDTSFKALVDAAIDADKTESKKTSGTYAQVDIDKQADGTYKITENNLK